MARTSNDDLAQSAYDSALAGIEDAKLAYYNYEACKEKGVSGKPPTDDSSMDCSSIVYFVDGGEENSEKDCDMVAKILGREYDEGGVLIQESTTGSNNNMQQAYTCVTIEPILSDYRSTLSESNTTQVVRVRLANVSASEIKKVKLSWYSEANDELSGYNYNNFRNNSVTFPPLKSGAQAAAPPMLSVGLVQTADSFSLSDFDVTSDGATNRGMIYLVPTKKDEKGNVENNYTGVYDENEEKNTISSSQIVKTNDRTVKNLPFAVYCPGLGENEEEFACSVELNLPSPIGGERNDETFAFVVTLPYGQPDTDFAMEFYCGEGGCGKTEEGTEGNSLAQLRGMQLKVDSTGRANNLYRRIEARLEAEDTFFPYPLYAIELLGDDKNGPLLSKDLTVTKENNDYSLSLGEYGNWGNELTK